MLRHNFTDPAASPYLKLRNLIGPNLIGLLIFAVLVTNWRSVLSEVVRDVPLLRKQFQP